MLTYLFGFSVLGVLAPAQRAVVWFFLVASVLFVGPTLVGGLSAHDRAEPGSFFGGNLSAQREGLSLSLGSP
jgi:nitric oxide reductase large subunit